MKKLIVIIILFSSITAVQAQLGGLLKKAKDKVTAPTQTNRVETADNHGVYTGTIGCHV